MVQQASVADSRHSELGEVRVRRGWRDLEDIDRARSVRDETLQRVRLGRILQATLTSEGQRRLEGANPAIRALERATERGWSSDELGTVKAWLVATAQRLEHGTGGED
jgi:hypothetical protein